MTARKDLKSKILSASKWSVMGELSSKVITPLVFLILARILSPADFGVASAAVMVISFSQLIWDAGLGRALIQSEAESLESANTVFWANAALSLAVYAVCYFAAPWIADSFQDTRVTAVVRVQGIQMVVNALGAVQRALLQRQLDFRRLFFIRLSTSCLPGIASVPLALAGYGYWALVGGALTGAGAELAMLWSGSDWKPCLTFSRKLARGLGSFGLWVMGEGLLSWAIGWIDAILVGRYFGTKDLGVYRTGVTLVSMLFAVTLSPILPVLFSAFSRLQSNKSEFLHAYLKVVKALALVALPLGASLFCLQKEIAHIALGEKWAGAAPVIGYIGCMHGFSWLVGANPEAYRALGHPAVNVKVNLLTLSYYVPSLCVAASYGLGVFLPVRILIALVALPIHVVIAMRMFGVELGLLWSQVRWSMLGALLVVVFTLGLSHWLPSSLPAVVRGLALGLCALGSYLVCVWPEREFITAVLAKVLRRA